MVAAVAGTHTHTMSEPETPLPGPSTKEQREAAAAAAATSGGGGGAGAGAGAAAGPAPFVTYEGPKNKDGQRHGDNGEFFKMMHVLACRDWLGGDIRVGRGAPHPLKSKLNTIPQS